MSRIAGLGGFNETASVSPLVEAMLEGLPGETNSISSLEVASFGWKGWKYGPAGGVGGKDSCLVAIDGRILNTVELSSLYDTAGDDAEIFLTLYSSLGFVKAMQSICGDFSIALYDAEEDTFWLGRDRVGVKPLYYASLKNGFGFSSQTRGLLALPDVTPKLNAGFVARFAGMHYRLFDNLPEESPFAQISQLPAGHVVQVKKGVIAKPKRYWELRDLPEWTESEDVLAEQYRELLTKVVARRVNAVDKPAFTLSGGLDSSSVLCCAADIQNKKQYAVSTVYLDKTYDERDEIRDVVDEKVSEWDPIEIPNEIDLFQMVEDLVRVHDEPVATATWLPHYILAQNISEKGFTALFGGLGGDELNAGEYEYFPMQFADLAAQGRTEELEHEITAWAHHHDHPIFKKNPQVAKELMRRMADLKNPGVCLQDRQRMMRYSDVVNKEYFDLETFIPVMDTPFTSYLKNRTYQDLIRETTPCCLRAEDRQCTAVGLEHFDPFLDHELIEFMYRVPGTMKIRDGITKRLLRRAMKGILPDATRERIAKTGWNAPAHQWFQGKTIEKLKKLVCSDMFRQQGVFKKDAVLALIDEHAEIVESGAQKENHMMFLWQLLNLTLWIKTIEQDFD